MQANCNEKVKKHIQYKTLRESWWFHLRWEPSYSFLLYQVSTADALLSLRLWDDQNENFERTLVLAVAEDDDDGFSSRRRQQGREKGACRRHYSSSGNQRYVSLSKT